MKRNVMLGYHQSCSIKSLGKQDQPPPQKQANDIFDMGKELVKVNY